MKYVKKLEIVEAVKYESGMEDGFSCMSSTMTCVFRNSNGDYKQCDECTVDIPKRPYFEHEFGKYHFDECDYIITDGDYRYHMTDTELHDLFIGCDNIAHEIMIKIPSVAKVEMYEDD